MVAKILTKLTAFKPKHITHKVNDVEFKFYPVHVKLFVSSEIRKIVSPIVEVVQTIFAGPAASTNEHWREITAEGSSEMTKAASVETLSFMESLRGKTRDRAVEIFTSDETRYQIGRLLASSLRDEFPDPSDATYEDTVREFVDSTQMDLSTFFQFCSGFLKANAAVLGLGEGGGLGERMRELMELVIARKKAELTGQFAPEAGLDLDLPELENLDDEEESEPSM